MPFEPEKRRKTRWSNPSHHSRAATWAPASNRRLLLIPLYAALIVGGIFLERQVLDFESLFAQLRAEAYRPSIILAVLAIYVLVMAVPFVPGAEIGLGLLLILGPEIAVLVYASTVLALTLAYLVGRAIPASRCAAVLACLGLKRTSELVLKLATLEERARLELLIAHAPRRFLPQLLRHRYLALAMAVNLPGNTLLGGGGGIALIAGLSRLYPMPLYIMTIAIAVSPLPLIFGLSPLIWPN